MKTYMDKENFIKLRAQGFSYDKIASELDISKPTLIKWNEECRNEIANLRYFELESLITQYGIAKKARIEVLAILLEKVLDELRDRSFEEVPVKDLMLLLSQLDAKIKSEFSSCQYFTDSYHTGLETVVLDTLREKTLPLVY